MEATQSRETDTLLTTAEAAEYLRVARTTIYSWVHRRQIPFVRLGAGKGSIRLWKSDLLDFLSTRHHGVR